MVHGVVKELDTVYLATKRQQEASLCLLVGALNPFTFKVIIGMYAAMKFKDAYSLEGKL